MVVVAAWRYPRLSRDSLVWIGVFDTRTLPNGTYTLRSRATDAAGNVGVSGPVTIRIRN